MLTCPLCRTEPSHVQRFVTGSFTSCDCSRFGVFNLEDQEILWQFVYRIRLYHYIIRRQGDSFIHIAPGLFVEPVPQDEVSDLTFRLVSESVIEAVIET